MDAVYDGRRVCNEHCVIWQKYTQKPNKLFFSAPVRARAILSLFLDTSYSSYTSVRHICNVRHVLLWTDTVNFRKFRYVFDIFDIFQKFRYIFGQRF